MHTKIKPTGTLRLPFVLILLSMVACNSEPAVEPTPTAQASKEAPGGTVLKAGFVVLEGVFNSELMAPYDVLHHSIFRDPDNYIEPFIVSPDGKPVTTFEGITVMAHYAFDTAPDIDILVLPSTENSMGADLQNPVFMAWLKEAVANAQYVITVCDGAFPLAATGVLDGRKATTFPGDREAFAERFPDIDVQFEANFVMDGKFITSVGGAMSYEPAFFLVEHLYGPEHADLTAEGLVWDWNLDQIPHLVVKPQAASL